MLSRISRSSSRIDPTTNEVGVNLLADYLVSVARALSVLQNLVRASRISDDETMRCEETRCPLVMVRAGVVALRRGHADTRVDFAVLAIAWRSVGERRGAADLRRPLLD
jgi:hypothetical protein